LIPHADRAFSALVTDLDQRGLLDTTLVVMMGEMGRTPRINKEAGRDHWSMAQSVLFAGGGIKPGQVVGATDKQGAAPTTTPVSVEDLLHTIFHLMGIDPTKSYLTPLGRPVPIVNGGRVVKELLV
jgi:arylsulfatase A-like enzyme